MTIIIYIPFIDIIICTLYIIMNLWKNRKGSHMPRVIVNYIASYIYPYNTSTTRIEQYIQYEHYIILYTKFALQKMRFESDFIRYILYYIIAYYIIYANRLQCLFSFLSIYIYIYLLRPKRPLCVRIWHDNNI